MPRSRARLTRRGYVALGSVVLLVAVLTVVVLDLNRSPGCTVRSGSSTVHLDRGRAESAGDAAATGFRRSQSLSAVTSAIGRSAHLAPRDAAVVSGALTGQLHAALVCGYGGAGSTESDRLDAEGLTRRAQLVLDDVRTRFGPVPYGGFAPGGVHTGHMPGSAHYEGRAIDLFFRPISARSKTRGWALAQYLVTQAARLKINTVIFDGEVWTARKADQGWRTYRVSHTGKSPATIRILEHRDHVHVDVAD
ncbi:MAG: hypothetical protein ACJ72D_21620 [Marmoricola sp.]